MHEMSGFTARRRRAAALVPPLLLLLTVAGSAYVFVRMRVSRGWVAHTHVVIETAGRVSADLLEAESAQRGYLLTGQKSYLPRYLVGLGALDRDTAQLRQLSRDNESQQRRLDALTPLVRERLELLAVGVHLRSMGVDTVLSEARLDRGRVVMDSIRSVMVALQNEEAALLDERVAREERQVLALGLVFLLGIVASGLAGYVVNRALNGYARAQRKAFAHIEEQNHELQEQAVELELHRDSLEEQATELEILNEQLTERTQAAERAQESADELRQRTDMVLASISDVFFMLDAAGRVHYANRLARALLGADDVEGRVLEELAPELAARLDAPLRQAAQSRQVIRFDEYYPPASLYFAAALYPSDAGVSVFLHDVTASHERQAEFKVMTEAMPQLVWSADSDGNVDYWNDRWCAYTGMAMAADLNEHWLTYLHPEDAPAARRAWDHAISTGEPYEVEYRLRRAADGEYRWFVSRGLPVRAPDGKILRWFGTSTDIHDERTAVQAMQRLSRELKARVDELETMFEVLPFGIGVSHDPACADIRVNPALARMLGTDPEANVSKGQPGPAPAYRVFRDGVEVPIDDLPMQWAARQARPLVNSEFEIRLPEGEPLHMLASAAPLLDEHGAVRGAIGGFVDVSRRVRAEAESRRLAERTAKLYALSAALTRAATPEQVAGVAAQWGQDVLGASATIFLVLK
ncbi:MAG TPA: PAS domain-containing protein, partial [Longimicrobiales bacterium]